MIEIPRDLFTTLIQLFSTRLGGHLCVRRKYDVNKDAIYNNLPE